MIVVAAVIFIFIVLVAVIVILLMYLIMAVVVVLETAGSGCGVWVPGVHGGEAWFNELFMRWLNARWEPFDSGHSIK